MRPGLLPLQELPLNSMGLAHKLWYQLLITWWSKTGGKRSGRMPMVSTSSLGHWGCIQMTSLFEWRAQRTCVTLEGTETISPKSHTQGICSLKPKLVLFHSPKELDDTNGPDLRPNFIRVFFLERLTPSKSVYRTAGQMQQFFSLTSSLLI